MATIKINNQEYDVDMLSAEAKEQLKNIRFVNKELARLNAQIAVVQTAKNLYAQTLKNIVSKEGNSTIN